MSAITSTREDYLRAIYLFAEHGQRARLVDLARQLGLARSTVSERVKELELAKLVKLNPNQGVMLTRQGNFLAKQLTYKHRLIEVFLHKILGMNPKNVHAEAHKLEHAFSDQVIKRLAKFLGNPTRDPHGEKIVKA